MATGPPSKSTLVSSALACRVFGCCWSAYFQTLWKLKKDLKLEVTPKETTGINAAGKKPEASSTQEVLISGTVASLQMMTMMREVARIILSQYVANALKINGIYGLLYIHISSRNNPLLLDLVIASCRRDSNQATYCDTFS